MHSRLITVICVVVGKCMYLVVCPYVLCMNRISLSDAALHIFAFECPNHSECCRFCRCRCCCYCRFDTAHFTFYSRFLCTWLKIMCSVSLPSLVYLFALLFVDFSRIHSVSLSPFSIIISFLFALVFFIAYYRAKILLHKSVTSQRFNLYILVCLFFIFKCSFGTISLRILMEMCISELNIWSFCAIQIRIETCAAS